jgi:hypothetical protein
MASSCQSRGSRVNRRSLWSRPRGGLGTGVALAVLAVTAGGFTAAPPAAALTAATTTLAQAATGATPAASPLAAGTARWPATSGPLGTAQACTAPAQGYVACQALGDTSLHWYGTAWATGAPPAVSPRPAPPAPPAPPADPGPAEATPAGISLAPFMAADLQAAYKLPSSLLGGRQTVAIVDAYDDPDAAADLAAYRQANHLHPCDAAFECFEKVNQEGQQGDYPHPNGGWAVEESLDLDMVSAVCPNCKIILVEADNGSIANMWAAEDAAAKLGANVISNSYGAPEFAGEAAAGAAFDHPGIAIVAAAGDNGFGTEVPAAYGSVIAAGGTTLYRDASRRGWSEDAWSGDGVTATGSGCSAYIAKPAWQHDKLCGTRTVADVSAVADPATPVAIYDTDGHAGWIAVGGTSVATPIIAGVYALAGNAAAITPGAWLYAHHRSLFDVTSGFEGTPGANGDCGGSYLCTAGPGYDGPTGWGSPNGIGAF